MKLFVMLEHPFRVLGAHLLKNTVCVFVFSWSRTAHCIVTKVQTVTIFIICVKKKGQAIPVTGREGP
jgi:hypothetical protein